jgi:hypothetical protein
MKFSVCCARPEAKGFFLPGAPLFFVVAVIIAVAGLIWAVADHTVLVARDTKTGKVLEIGSISEGDTFELRFIHSVDILPVRDFFLYHNGCLFLTQTRCLSFGAGLGYTGQGDLKGEDGWNVIDNMNRRVVTLPLRLGSIADHTIIFKGKELSLKKYYAPQSLLQIGVEHKWRI